jgi:aldehyde:ferredoxin oxidoreductase
MGKREEYPGGYFLSVQAWVLFHRLKLGTFSPAAIGGHVLNKLDFEKMLKDYYKLRGWDHDGAPPSWERGSA